VGSYVVIRSEFIETLEEARAYYRDRLVGSHDVTCHGRAVTIVFEADNTHLFSTESKDWRTVAANVRVDRQFGNGKIETREFCPIRARLLDDVIRSICHFTISIPGTGPRGAQNRMLHGPALPNGEYLRVVLRPGPGGAHTCVSAYPVALAVWRSAVRAKRAKFPPKRTAPATLRSSGPGNESGPCGLTGRPFESFRTDVLRSFEKLNAQCFDCHALLLQA